MSNQKQTARAVYKKSDAKNPTIAKYSRNLNLCYLNGQLDPCCHREELLTLIQKTLLRKNKPNVLLTGMAGCGKTALAEGLAAVITQRKLQYLTLCEKNLREHKKAVDAWEAGGSVGECPAYVSPPRPPLCDCVVYDLSMNSMVGGTRYRGDFEERMEQLLHECSSDPDVILFIDEFHTVITDGATQESSAGAAQLLKPALARGTVRLIGATTDEEKDRILQDKALARRFCQLEVRQLQADAALDTARTLLKHYCGHHNISTTATAEEILSLVRYHLPQTVFPDNFLNVVDETLAGAVFDGLTNVTKKDFIKTLSRMTGRIILELDGPGICRAG